MHAPAPALGRGFFAPSAGKGIAMAKYETGQKVAWNWGNGEGTGTVREIFTESVTRELQGSEITRHGSEDDPAYLIEQDDGAEVLKGETELKDA